METQILAVDNDLCHLQAVIDDAAPGLPIIHLTMKSWGRLESKLWKFVWGQFKQALRDMGYTHASAVVDKDNDKLIRFSTMSGMSTAFDNGTTLLMVTEV